LQEQTDAGRPTLRAYITIYLASKQKAALLFNITPRAATAGGAEVPALLDEIGKANYRSLGTQYVEHEIRLTAPLWRTHLAAFEAALTSIYSGWQHRGSTSVGLEVEE
jgi:hypothetical protein